MKIIKSQDLTVDDWYTMFTRQSLRNVAREYGIAFKADKAELAREIFLKIPPDKDITLWN